MRLRVATVTAFGIGYLLGSRAGRERYHQIMAVLSHLGQSAPVSGTASLVTTKSRAVATLGVERLKDTVGVRLGWRDGDQAADALAVEMAEDLATALNHRRHRSDLSSPRHRRRQPALAHASSR